MHLSEFVELFRHLEPEAFRDRFPDPFLLEAEDGEPRAERRVFPLRVVGASIRVGRGSRCHVPIPEPLVSTTHAELLPPAEPGQPWRLQDLGSTNQTFVDGEPLPDGGSTSLRCGTRIGFGPESRFLFLSSQRFLEDFRQALDSPQRTENDTTVASGIPAALGGARLVPGQLRTQSPRATAEQLLLVSPSIDPYPLQINTRVVLGRQSRTCDVILASDQVSRRHAELERRESGVFARDLGSSNGTWVADAQLTQEWYPVPLSTPIVIGSYRLYVEKVQTLAEHLDTRRFPRKGESPGT